jgi:hypothetical protein
MAWSATIISTTRDVSNRQLELVYDVTDGTRTARVTRNIKVVQTSRLNLERQVFAIIRGDLNNRDFIDSSIQALNAWDEQQLLGPVVLPPSSDPPTPRDLAIRDFANAVVVYNSTKGKQELGLANNADVNAAKANLLGLYNATPTLQSEFDKLLEDI